MFGRFFRKKDAKGNNGSEIYIVAGLGNPGKKYEKTRHNAGYDALDEIIERYSIPKGGRKFSSIYGKGRIEGRSVVAMKPLTYMNKSGDAIIQAAKYFKTDTKTHLIVLVDDINLEPGVIRIRKKGSAGGHNGLKSIIYRTGSEEFVRIRIGVGKQHDGADQIEYVLSRITGRDRQMIEDAFKDVAEAVALIIQGNVDEAMNRFNGKRPEGQ